MGRDYKHRADSAGSGSGRKRATGQTKKRKPVARARVKSREKQGKVPVWRWALVFLIIALFVYFLYSLSLKTQQDQPAKTVANRDARQTTKLAIKKPAKKVVVAKKTSPKKSQSQEIQYDFYTILPEAEFVIPDHEVKTRKREERVGKAKTGVNYSVQAGAFRQYKDADSLKAKLLMMGFSPKIEKAVIGSATWHRVKMGPYNRLASVDAIQSKLRANNMDALVIEVKK